MPPAPLTASIITGVVGTLGLVHLAIDPTPFDDQRSLLIALGMAVLTLVTTTGVLLARGRWGRWTLLGLGGAWMALAVRSELDPLAAAILIGGAAMLSIAAGPWLPRWLRHRPSADGPPPTAVGLLLSLLAVPVLVGILGEAAGAPEWAFSAWSLAVAAGIARAVPAMLWGGRLLHLPAAIGVALSIGLPGGPVIVAVAAAQTALLWRRDLRVAVSPLAPQPAATVPIPRELVDPAILRAAGLDAEGRPLEDS